MGISAKRLTYLEPSLSILNQYVEGMNLVFLGKGKLAQVTMEIAQERGHQLVGVHDSAHPWVTPINKNDVDMVFEMSRPELVHAHVLSALEQGLPMVIGTTGWYDRLPEIKEHCERLEGSVLWASNFAPGVQVFRRLGRTLAAMLDALPDFQLELHESHHLQKLDSPSGTAIQTAQDLLSSSNRYRRWLPELSADPQTLPIISHRLEDEVGTHTLVAQSDFEHISLEHKANHRRAFGLGAVLAAEWLKQRQGFLRED